MRVSRLSAIAVGLGVTLAPLAASGSMSLPLVRENPADYTPQVVSTTAVPRPSVDGIASGPATTYAGGKFDLVKDKSGATYQRSNLMAFDTNTGDVITGFKPTFNNVVRDVEDAPNGGVYVGGDFTAVNGVTTTQRLTKLTAAGTVDPTFKPTLIKGIVNDVDLYDGHLLVAGAFGRHLVSLDPTTGADDGYISATFAGAAKNTDGTKTSWGTAGTVYDVAASDTPQGKRLIAVGNFTTVNGASRGKFAMLNLPGGSLNGWYYNAFATPCSTDAPRRIANLQGVDWAPGGAAFDVAATGQVPELKSQIWHQGQGAQSNATVCDGFGRFALGDSSRAQWINYTGGDSCWEIADTGSAVYVQGHFKWVDNADGWASHPAYYDANNQPIGDTINKTVAHRRSGIAAIDPNTGRALDWSPAVPTQSGGRALDVTSKGLWVGTDSAQFGGEPHYGLGLAPAS